MEAKRPVETKRPVDGRRPKGLNGVLKIVTLLGGRPAPANVTVDGVDRGKSPVTLELTAAQHTVRIERPGFQNIEQAVIVPNGGAKEMKVELVP